MKKGFFILLSIVFVSVILFLSAVEYSGDGTYTVSKGDIITIDNGWKVEIISVGVGSYSEIINFRLYDLESVAYPSEPYQERFLKIEGRRKFGSSEVLKVEIEILEVFGEELDRQGVSWVEKENARINIVSIDEKLPGTVDSSGNELTEDINKEFTYKDSRGVSMSVEEEIILGNRYKLKLDRFDQRWGSPVFSLYDENNNLIENGIGSGKDVGRSLGSFVYVEDYDGIIVNLKIIDGSKITFGTGWNLFSISLEDGDGFGTVLESTCNEATIWKWDSEVDDYFSLGILVEGAKLPANEGLWVKIQTKQNTQGDMDCEIIVSGTEAASTEGQQLKAGWNLIGAPISSYGYREVMEDSSTFNFLSFEDILGDCRIEKGPWQFLATKYTHDSIVSDILDTRQYSEPFNGNLRLNRGYFIKVIDDCTLKDK